MTSNLTDTIRNGVQGTDMPPSPLPEPEIKRMIAFVRSLERARYRHPAAREIQNAGREIFFGKGGCAEVSRHRRERCDFSDPISPTPEPARPRPVAGIASRPEQAHRGRI